MDWIMIWKTVLIGIVEGLTEFLPVSSTGHIILAEEVLHFQGPPGKVFEIVIQLGAIFAICVLYRAKIMLTVSGVLKREPVATRFATAVIVAFLPAAVIGVALHKYIKALLDKPIVVAVALIVGGVAILVIEKLAQRPRIKSVDDIDWKTALMRGRCASFSITRMATPPTINATATTIGLSSSALMYLCSATPTTAAGRKATITAVAKRVATGSRFSTPDTVSMILTR